jgi:hypothetical protein
MITVIISNITSNSILTLIKSITMPITILYIMSAITLNISIRILAVIMLSLSVLYSPLVILYSRV